MRGYRACGKNPQRRAEKPVPFKDGFSPPWGQKGESPGRGGLDDPPNPLFTLPRYDPTPLLPPSPRSLDAGPGRAGCGPGPHTMEKLRQEGNGDRQLRARIFRCASSEIEGLTNGNVKLGAALRLEAEGRLPPPSPLLPGPWEPRRLAAAHSPRSRAAALGM
uniref:Uncharacterized protein n=1 Tax=Knipowitschia caucasica TaxID=637954 RepID=A0AAV2LDZ2_KNICA